MINQLFLVGIIKQLPLFNSFSSGGEFTIEVRRNYKNSEGVFKKDVFKCHLWMAISKRIVLCCKEGDLVAVKGRLIEENNNYNIVAEQVILLNKGIDKL